MGVLQAPGTAGRPPSPDPLLLTSLTRSLPLHPAHPALPPSAEKCEQLPPSISAGLQVRADRPCHIDDTLALDLTFQPLYFQFHFELHSYLVFFFLRIRINPAPDRFIKNSPWNFKIMTVL